MAVVNLATVGLFWYDKHQATAGASTSGSTGVMICDKVLCLKAKIPMTLYGKRLRVVWPQKDHGLIRSFPDGLVFKDIVKTPTEHWTVHIGHQPSPKPCAQIVLFVRFNTQCVLSVWRTWALVGQGCRTQRGGFVQSIWRVGSSS